VSGWVLILTAVMYTDRGITSSVTHIAVHSFEQCDRIGQRWKEKIRVGKSDDVFYICEKRL